MKRSFDFELRGRVSGKVLQHEVQRTSERLGQHMPTAKLAEGNPESETIRVGADIQDTQCIERRNII